MSRPYAAARLTDDRELWRAATTRRDSDGTTLLDYIQNHLRSGFEFNCWLWTGHLNSAGYAQVHIKNQKWLVHRLLFELYRGSTYGLDLEHTCQTLSCCNPWHLELAAATTKKRLRKPKKLCPHGHTPPSGCPHCRHARKAANKERARRAAATRKANQQPKNAGAGRQTGGIAGNGGDTEKAPLQSAREVGREVI